MPRAFAVHLRQVPIVHHGGVRSVSTVSTHALCAQLLLLVCLVCGGAGRGHTAGDARGRLLVGTLEDMAIEDGVVAFGAHNAREVPTGRPGGAQGKQTGGGMSG